MTELSEFRVESDSAKRLILDMLLEFADVISKDAPNDHPIQADMEIVYHDFTLCRVYPELVRIHVQHLRGKEDPATIMIANRIPDTKKSLITIPRLPFLDEETVDLIRALIGSYA